MIGANLAGGTWRPLAPEGPGVIESRNPAWPEQVVWRGVPDGAQVDQAVAAAAEAFRVWSRWPFERRAAVLLRLRTLYQHHAEDLASLITDETGKVLWDARQEAAALVSKVDITLDESPLGPRTRVRGFEVALDHGRVGRCWFRPHGVMAVIAPFNFPAHLANGHIVPALAMGNTVVLKPSDKAPATGQRLAELIAQALQAEGAPPGVINLVHGGGEVAQRLVRHEGVNGILFTGSWPVGRSILEANLDTPGRIVALEMGGNNAAVVLPDADLRQAVIECVRSAFITSGQRCTCTRRIVVHEAVADRFMAALCRATSQLVIGEPRAAHPVFMGPVISRAARDAVLRFQRRAAAGGAEVLVQASAIETPAGGWYLSPAVLRVERFVARDAGGGDAIEPGCDEEVFGPLVRVAVVRDVDEAIEQANATRYGLVAAIFTRDPAAADRFCAEARSGCINVNAGTAGASSRLPFGGLGRSGNHRPAGAFSLDYCAYPVAGIVEAAAGSPLPPGMHFEDRWLR